jgi:hypothetical protein
MGGRPLYRRSTTEIERLRSSSSTENGARLWTSRARRRAKKQGFPGVGAICPKRVPICLFESILLLTLRGPITRMPGSYVCGGVLKRPTRADCKSAGLCLRRFESFPLHHVLKAWEEPVGQFELRFIKEPDEGGRIYRRRALWCWVLGRWDTGRAKIALGGCSSMVEPQPSKLMVWVRFPSPAPLACV